MKQATSQLLTYASYLVTWIQNEVKKAGRVGVVVGMSGGVDSSVVAYLAQQAFPHQSLGVMLPIGHMGQDLDDAQLVALTINIATQTINLTKSFHQFKKQLGIKNFLAQANIKPRLRMTTLYALAQEHQYLVLGTDNAAEWALGYFTKYGDGGADILPLVQLNKGQVIKLAQELHLPPRVYNKQPSAGLWKHQTDEAELGFTYAEVDKYLSQQQIAHSIKIKIQRQEALTQHKRQALPTPKKFPSL